MKTKFQKILSVICIFTLLLTSVSSFAIAETADDVSIITAQFLPYEQEIRVLASVPEGYTGKVLVNGTEVTSVASASGDNTLYTASYTPTVYGIIPVTLEATKDGVTVSDTKNVSFIKASSKKELLDEDFDLLSSAEMIATSDAKVQDIIATTDFVTLPNITTNTSKSTASIVSGFNKEDSNDKTIVFNVPARKTSGLPQINFDPSVNAENGIVEFVFDIYSTKPNARIGILPYSTNNKNFNFTTSLLTEASVQTQNTTYYILQHDNNTYAYSNLEQKNNMWHNVRFKMNLNKHTYEYYVDDIIVDLGTYVCASGGSNNIGKVYFTIGNKYSTEAQIAMDDVQIHNTEYDIMPTSINYTCVDGTEIVPIDLYNAKIPFNTVDTINFEFDGIISSNNIIVNDSKGNIVNANISENNDGTNSTVSVSALSLSPNGVYTLVCGDIQIPFTAISEAVVFSPVAGTIVNKGTDVNLSACTPDAKYVDIFVNGSYVATPSVTDDCVGYLYSTSEETFGKKSVEFVIHKNDGTTKILTSTFVVNQVKESDITALDNFDSFVSQTTYGNLVPSTAGFDCAINNLYQQTDTSIKSIKSDISGNETSRENSLAIYYKATSSYLISKNALFIQDTFDPVHTGRIVLEHDLFINDTAGTLNYALYGKNGDIEHNFYILNDTSLISGGKIGTHNVTYGGEWHKLKIIVDFCKKSTEVYYDGEQIATANKLIDNKNIDVTAFQQIRINYKPGSKPTADTETFAFAIDNWRVYKEYPLPEISSVTSYDANANSTTLSEGGLVSNAVNKFSLEISNAIYANSDSLLSNITLTSGNTVINKENAVLSDGVLTFDVSNLPENADLKLTIGADTALYDGTTIGTDTVFNLKAADKNGLYAKKAISEDGNEVKAIYTLDALNEKSLNLIIATYNGNELVDVTVKPVTFADSQNISLTLPKAGTNKAKVFIWAEDGIKPVLAGNSEINY